METREITIAVKTPLFDRLKREAQYAKNSNSERLLYQSYGKASMAYELGAITWEQMREIDELTVVYMNSRNFIRAQNQQFMEQVSMTFLPRQELERRLAQMS